MNNLEKLKDDVGLSEYEELLCDNCRRGLVREQRRIGITADKLPSKLQTFRFSQAVLRTLCGVCIRNIGKKGQRDPALAGVSR